MLSSRPPISSPSPTPPTSSAWKWALALLVVFLLLRVPVAVDYFNYHYDEHFYTDGALEMMQGGDFLTPHYPDGMARFNKPPLTYWIVLSSFRVFGISPLSSRLPFLFVGVMLLWLTWRFASRVFGNADDALLTTAILACNATFFYHMGYAITDGLLSLWNLLAFYGFYRALVERDPRPRWLWCGYLGTGLAVATKGIPGLLALGTAVLYTLWRIFVARADVPRTSESAITPPETQSPAQRLLGWSALPGLIAGLAVAAAWPIAESFQNGMVFWRGFMNDQVTQRLEWPTLATGLLENAFINFWYYPAVLTQYFFPWSLLVLYALLRYRTQLRAVVAERKERWLFALIAIVLNVCIYLPPNIHRCRYLLPVFPFLSMLVVVALRQLQLERLLKALVVLLCSAELLAGIYCATQAAHDSVFIAYAAAALLIPVAVLWLAPRVSFAVRMACASLAIVLAFSLVDWIVNPAWEPCPSAELYSRLLAHGFSSGIVGLGSHIMYELPAHVRVLSAGKIQFKPIDPASPQRVCLINKNREPQLDTSGTGGGVELEPIGTGLRLSRTSSSTLLPGRNNDRLLWLLTRISGDNSRFTAQRRDLYLLEWYKDSARDERQSSTSLDHSHSDEHPH